MFGLIRKKKYDVLIEQNNMLSREVSKYREIHTNSGFWYIQKDKDTFVCSKCRNEANFTLDNIPVKCPSCNIRMIGLKNDPFRIRNEELNTLRAENEKLKNQVSSLEMDKESIEENLRFYTNKYRMLCDVMREIQNRISDENNQIPDKCPDCNSEIFYDPIGHYGMCLKCGKNFDMNKFWNYLNADKPEIPCDKCKLKFNKEET